MTISPRDNSPHRFCVAPMMDWTDRHCRFFHRQLTRRTLLYTEMVTADAVLHGDRDHLLGFDGTEHPVALQLGGSEPEKLARAARLGADAGYDEINLNVGCPSDRVQSGAFGAVLMKTPRLVADSMAAMAEAVDVPVTVKCRIGVDDQDPEESLFALVEACRAVGVRTFIIHARKAWLNGLSPKENRSVPPLNYALVRKVKQTFPDLTIVLNGGIETPAAGLLEIGRGTDENDETEERPMLDGMMLGRAAYHQPRLLAEVDRLVFGDNAPGPDLAGVIRAMHDYIAREGARNPGYFKPHNVTRHMLGLFHGRPGARLWRQILSADGARTPPDILHTALEALPPAAMAPQTAAA